MAAALLGGLLVGCAPSAQPVQTWEGSARVALREQRYRLTFTVNDQTHDLRGQLENRTSGDRFSVSGTWLPVGASATVTAQVSPGESPTLRASLLGFGVGDLPLKASALLTATVSGTNMAGELRIGGLNYPVQFRRTH